MRHKPCQSNTLDTAAKAQPWTQYQIIHTNTDGRVCILAACSDKFTAERALPREITWAKREGYDGPVTIRSVTIPPIHPAALPAEGLAASTGKPELPQKSFRTKRGAAMRVRFPSISFPEKYAYTYDRGAWHSRADVDPHFEMFETYGDNITQHSSTEAAS